MQSFHPLILVSFLGLCFAGAPKGEANSFDAIPFEQLLVDAANSSQSLDLFYDPANQVLLTEYDILLTTEEWENLHGLSKSRKKRTAGIKPNPTEKRWTNKVVSYSIDPTAGFSHAHLKEFMSAIADWEKFTCLKFKETKTATPRILIKNGRGCSSWVGMRQWPVQDLNLAVGCRHKRIIIHELGHAIGLHHEQTRPDRDEYITINFQNILSTMHYNFEKYNWTYLQDYGIEYDYSSIMHYSAIAFSKDGSLTIITKDSKYRYEIGVTPGLSYRDIRTVNMMYDCHKTTSQCTLKHSDCPNGGFVGKDCSCWCPGKDGTYIPVKHCDESGTRPPIVDTTTSAPTEDPGCIDEMLSCGEWASQGHCEGFGSFMNDHCKETCGLCPTGPTLPTKPTTPRKTTVDDGVTPDPKCRDTDDRCANWNEFNLCSTQPNLMNSLCPKTCKQC